MVLETGDEQSLLLELVASEADGSVRAGAEDRLAVDVVFERDGIDDAAVSDGRMRDVFFRLLLELVDVEIGDLCICAGGDH